VLTIFEYARHDKGIKDELFKLSKLIPVPKPVKGLSGQQLLKAHIAKLYNSKKDMDIKIIASNGKEYLTHKCILVVFSEYFRCIINGGFKETDQQEMRMNVDSNVLELVLEFI